MRQQTRLVNQLTAALKAYYPRAFEVAELTTALARAFLQAFPTPAAVAGLTARQWRPGRDQHLSEPRTTELWAGLQQPQVPVPAHVVRVKARLMRAQVAALTPVVEAVAAYRQEVKIRQHAGGGVGPDAAGG